jgi:hypothetical protein
VKDELTLAEATLRASRSISEQPDWSALMALLAAKAGDEIVLKTCLVRPRDLDHAVASPRSQGQGAVDGATGATQPPPAEPSMVLGLSGLGLSQAAVSQFILRLEGTRLFAKVTLIDTSRASFERMDVVGFRIECSLDEPTGGGPTLPPAAPPVAAGPPGARAGRSPTAGVDLRDAGGTGPLGSDGGVKQ